MCPDTGRLCCPVQYPQVLRGHVALRVGRGSRGQEDGGPANLAQEESHIYQVRFSFMVKHLQAISPTNLCCTYSAHIHNKQEQTKNNLVTHRTKKRLPAEGVNHSSLIGVSAKRRPLTKRLPVLARFL